MFLSIQGTGLGSVCFVCSPLKRTRMGSLSTDVVSRTVMPILMSVSIALGLSFPAHAWKESDQQAYHNKMALLKIMLEGARMRAVETNDLQTLCLIMSIGNDVTVRYVQLNPNDQEIQNRLDGMRNDMTACLGLLYSQ